VFFINLRIAKLVHDAEYHATTYWKAVHNYFGTSEGNVLKVHRSDGSRILISYLHLGQGFFEEVGWSKTCCQTRGYWSYWGDK